MPAPRVLRRIFPTVTPCPRCRCTQYVPSGSSRGGRMRYRTCAQCSHRYVATADAEEVLDDGATRSRIVKYS